MARQNGEQQSDGDGSAETSDNDAPVEAPRLTLGQKLLVALPDLSRSRTGTATRAQKPRSRTAPVSDDIQKGSDRVDDLHPDETAHKDTVEPDGTAQNDDPDALDNSFHVEDAELVESTGRPTPAGGLLSGLLRGGAGSQKSGAAVYDGMKTSDLTTLMRKLDDRERRFAMMAAPLGAVLAVVLTAITLHHDPVGKGHESTSVITWDGGLSVAFAACVFATAWFRRRSLTAFALLFLGYSLGLIGIGIPFLVLGGYLLFKAWRIQKVLTSRGVNTRTRQPARTAAERASPRSQARNPKGGQDKGASSRPVQNKRYTPPKPAPKQAISKAERAAKPEKSSWFERTTRSTPAEPS